MARRPRVIAAGLGLIILFIYISSRNSGSHPRDMRNAAVQQTSEELRAILKEPPGQWDPVADKFRGGFDISSQERLADIAQHGGDLPEDVFHRKTPKKTGQKAAIHDIDSKEETESLQKGHGHGPLVPDEPEIVVEEYDPAEGARFSNVS
jgi:hypothetical protein